MLFVNLLLLSFAHCSPLIRRQATVSDGAIFQNATVLPPQAPLFLLDDGSSAAVAPDGVIAELSYDGLNFTVYNNQSQDIGNVSIIEPAFQASETDFEDFLSSRKRRSTPSSIQLRDWHPPETRIYFQILETGFWMSVTFWLGPEYYPITHDVMLHVVARLQIDLQEISQRHGGVTNTIPRETALRCTTPTGAQFYFWAVRQTGGPTWGTLTLALAEVTRLAVENNHLIQRWAIFSGDVRHQHNADVLCHGEFMGGDCPYMDNFNELRHRRSV